MQTKSQKNLFLFLMIGSNIIYSADSNDHTTSTIPDQVYVDSEHYERSQEVHTIKDDQAVQELVKELHKEKLDLFLDDTIQNSKNFVEAILDSSFMKKSKEQLSYLKGNDYFELKINKVGLGAAGLGMATVLGFNRITKPGVIRNKLIFKRCLGLGSGYLFYKLVATNDDVKKDICDFFTKIKKD